VNWWTCVLYINRSGPVFWDTVYIINWYTLSSVYFMLIFCLLLSRNIQLYDTAVKLSWKFGINQYQHSTTLTLKLANTNVHQKGKGKGGPYSRRRVGGVSHLPFIGRWASRWINHYWLWHLASATPDLRLPSQPKLVLITPTHRGMARLSWPGWLVTHRDSLPTR